VDNLKNYFLAAALAGGFYLGTAQISFGQNVITDGNFTSLTPTNTGGQLGDEVTAAGWSSTGYNFVFPSGDAGDVAVTGSDGALSLWGPNTGSANGLTTPPNGGNVVADDGAYEVGPLTQSVSVKPSTTYVVSFYWAGAQQSGFNGATTEGWSVALGAPTGVYTQGSGDTSGTLAGGQTITPVANVSHGFTGWMLQSFDFTTPSGSNPETETLYFLANGTPTGEPPFSLLSGVTMTVVPEPATSATWTLLFGMLILAGNRAWRLYQKRSATNS